MRNESGNLLVTSTTFVRTGQPLLHEPLALIYARKKEQVLFKLLFGFRPKRARKLFSYTVRLVM